MKNEKGDYRVFSKAFTLQQFSSSVEANAKRTLQGKYVSILTVEEKNESSIQGYLFVRGSIQLRSTNDEKRIEKVSKNRYLEFFLCMLGFFSSTELAAVSPLIGWKKRCHSFVLKTVPTRVRGVKTSFVVMK